VQWQRPDGSIKLRISKCNNAIHVQLCNDTAQTRFWSSRNCIPFVCVTSYLRLNLLTDEPTLSGDARLIKVSTLHLALDTIFTGRASQSDIYNSISILELSRHRGGFHPPHHKSNEVRRGSWLVARGASVELSGDLKLTCSNASRADWAWIMAHLLHWPKATYIAIACPQWAVEGTIASSLWNPDYYYSSLINQQRSSRNFFRHHGSAMEKDQIKHSSWAHGIPRTNSWSKLHVSKTLRNLMISFQMADEIIAGRKGHPN